MSQALIDLDISHEEFKTIVNEKEKYEQMKEGIRKTRSRDELSENSRDIKKIMEMHRFKKKLFCVHKMVDVSAETFAKNYIHTIKQLKKDKEPVLWIRIKDIGEKLDVKSIGDLIYKEIKGKFETNYLAKQQIRKYKRHGSEFIQHTKFMYAHECIIIPIIIHCRVSTPKTI